MTQRPPYQSVFQIVRRHARERGNKVHAIAAESGLEVTFNRVYALCNQMASFLAKRGFKANDRVSVLSDNCLSQMLLFHMVQAYGATVNLVNCEVHIKNVEQILYDIDPTAPPPTQPDQFEIRMETLFDTLAEGWTITTPEDQPTLLAVLAHALAFETWRSLTAGGLTDEQAINLLASIVESVATGSIAIRG